MNSNERAVAFHLSNLEQKFNQFCNIAENHPDSLIEINLESKLIFEN